jgi:hypothetical protein
MAELLKNLNLGNEPEAKAGFAGAAAGLLAGVTFDLEYLEHPSRSFDAKISKVQDGIRNISHLRGDLGIVSPQKQKAVKSFIARDTHHKQTELHKLVAHKPASPSSYVETGVALGSASLFGITAVALSVAVKQHLQNREQKQVATVRERELTEQASQIVDNEFERLESWLPRQQSDESTEE